MTIKFSDTLNKLYYNVEKPEENLANLEKVTRIAFNQRRKTLSNAL